MAAQSWQAAPVETRSDMNQTRIYLAIAVILVSNFMTALDASFSSSAHVAIASHFDKTNMASWPVNAFLICSITMQPLYASLSDCIGRRSIFLTSGALFLAGTSFSALAPSWVFLILARCLSGAAASGLMIMGSVVLTDVVGVKKRGYYQSINYVNFGTSSAIGSATGGAVVEGLGWRWLYMIQLPLCVITLFMVYFFVPANSVMPTGKAAKSLSDFTKVFDFKGAFVLILVLALWMFILGTAGNVLAWTSPFVLLASALLPCMVYLLVRVELGAVQPILPPLLAKFPYRNIVINAFFFSMINYIVMYNTTFFFQSVLVESPSLASTRLVIPSIAFTLVSAVSGAAIARLGTPKPTLWLSQILLCGGVACLVPMPSLLPTLQAPGILYSFCLALPILGVGMMAPSALLFLLGMSNSDNHATMNSGFIMMRSLGGITATSISTTIVQNVFHQIMRRHMVSPEAREQITKIRWNIDSLQNLQEPLRSQVIHAYKIGFTALYSLAALLSILIFVGFLGVTGQKAEHDIQDVARYEIVTEMEEQGS